MPSSTAGSTSLKAAGEEAVRYPVARGRGSSSAAVAISRCPARGGRVDRRGVRGGRRRNRCRGTRQRTPSPSRCRSIRAPRASTFASLCSRASCGRERLADPRAAALRLAINRDRNADAGAADSDPALCLAGRDRLCQLAAESGIVDAFGPVGAKIAHLVTLLGEPPDELVLEEVAGMIGGEGDAHFG